MCVICRHEEDVTLLEEVNSMNFVDACPVLTLLNVYKLLVESRSVFRPASFILV